jgi:hypothetical protein
MSQEQKPTPPANQPGAAGNRTPAQPIKAPTATVPTAKSEFFNYYQPFFSQAALLTADDSRQFCAARDAFFDSIAPENYLTALLVDELFTHIWRLRRYLKAEQLLLNFGIRNEHTKASSKTPPRLLAADEALDQFMTNALINDYLLPIQTLIERIKKLNLEALDLLSEFRNAEGALNAIVVNQVMPAAVVIKPATQPAATGQPANAAPARPAPPAKQG